jgi:hypothetical protein
MPRSESSAAHTTVAGDELPVRAQWLGLFLRLQAELNALGSVSIEVPELRPAFERLRDALD